MIAPSSWPDSLEQEARQPGSGRRTGRGRGWLTRHWPGREQPDQNGTRASTRAGVGTIRNLIDSNLPHDWEITPMSARAGEASTKRDTLLEAVLHFRTVLTEWDRFLDWVQAERRELADLRARFGSLERDQARLLDMCDRLGETYERVHEELQALRLTHEAVLREKQETREVLEAALRRLGR